MTYKFYILAIILISFFSCNEKNVPTQNLIASSTETLPISTDKDNVLQEKKIYTLKRNDNIVYNVTRDTIINEFKISINNKNIQDEYITQDLKLNDTIIIENYYPNFISSIKITKNREIISEIKITKEDLPEINNRYMNLNNSVLQSLKFINYDSESNLFQFKTSLHIPNTNFSDDYWVNINESGEYSINIINYYD